MRLAIGLITFFIVSTFFAGTAQAQKSETDNLQKEANKLFEEAKYAEAYPMFTQLLSIRKGDADITFKYGATLLYGSEKKAEAIPFLKKASLKSNIDPRVFYFLGKAYHLNYEFDNALSAYEEFSQKGDEKQIESLGLSLSIQQSNNGKSLLTQIKDVLVLDRINVDAGEFFRYYDLENLDGKILLAPEDFQSAIDKKKGHRSIIYTTPLSNIVYFSSYGKKGDTGTDIYYASRKGDGSWSEPNLLPAPINTKFNEDFPFMHSDGRTLYFCSEGHNSMGGFDIFRSTIEASTGSFSVPENLDFAINTPDDDLLYIADSINQNAFFASARASKQGELSVYEVKVDLVPSSIILLKGQFLSELDPSLKNARITVEDEQSKRQIGIFNTENDGGYILDFKYGGAYNFYVEAGGSGIIHTGKVEIPRLESIAAFRQELIMIDDNGVERLMIKNYFEEELSDEDTQVLLALALKRRANLDVTPEDELQEQLNLQQESALNANFDNLYLEAGMSQFHSNLDVANWLDMKAMELTKANAEYTELSAKAYSESVTYQAKAQEKILKAQDEFSAFEASEDNAEQTVLLKSFITLRNEAKVDLLNAEASALIAEKLNLILDDRRNIAAEIQNEELLIRQALLDKDQSAIESSMAKIAALNSKLKGPKYQADPSIYLSDIKELESMKAMQAYDSAEELRLEKKEQMDLLQRLETQLTKSKDKDKPAIEVRIAEVKGEIESIEEAIPEKWAKYSELDWNSKLAERSLEFANTWEYIGNENSSPDTEDLSASTEKLDAAHESVKVMEGKEEAALLSLGISYEELMKTKAIASDAGVDLDDLGDLDPENEESSAELVVDENIVEPKSIENALVSDFDKKLGALNDNPNKVDQLEGKILLNSELLREVNRNLQSESSEYEDEELTALKSKLELETVSMIDQFKKEIESKQGTDYTVSDYIPEYEEQKSNIESYSGSDLERKAKLSEFYAYSVDKLELILDSVNALPFPENDPYLMRQQLENQNALKIIITDLKVENYELKENVELLSTIANLPNEDEVISSIDADYEEKYVAIENSTDNIDVKAANLIQLNESLIVGLNEKLADKTQEFSTADSDQQVLVQSELDLLYQIKEEKEAEINEAVMDMATGDISADPLVEANEIEAVSLNENEKEELVNGLMPEFSKEKEAIDFSEMSSEQKNSKTLALFTTLSTSIDQKINELQGSESQGEELKQYQALKIEVDSEKKALEARVVEDRSISEAVISENESNNTKSQSNAWSGVIMYNAASSAIEEYEKSGKIAKDPGFDSESLRTQSEQYYAEIDEYNNLVLTIENLEKNERNLSDKELKKSKKEKEKLKEELALKETDLLDKWIPLIHVSSENITGGDDYLNSSKSLLEEAQSLKDEEKLEKLRSAYVLSIMSLKEGYHQQLDDNRVAGIPIAKLNGDGLDYNGLTIDEKKLVLQRNIEKLKESILDAEEQKALNAEDPLKIEEWNIIAKTYQDALVWNQNELAKLNTLQSDVKSQSEKFISFIKAPTAKDAFKNELEKVGITEEQSAIITSDPEIQTYYAMQYVEGEVQNKINGLKRMRSAYREEGDQAISNYYDGSLVTQGESSLVIDEYKENAKRYQEAISWYQKTDSLDLLISSLEAKQVSLKQDKQVYYSGLETVNKQTITDIKEGRTPLIAIIDESKNTLEEEDPVIVDSETIDEFVEETTYTEEEAVLEDNIEESIDDTPVFGDPTLSGFIFESGQSFYNDQEPIPVNPPMPEGLVFKIQIGAFRNALPPEHFVGLSPMMAEKLPNGITRYSVGIFRVLDEARGAQTQVRSIGYPDAFIVAFYNGIRITLNEAKRLLDGEDSSTIASISNAVDQGSNSSDQNNSSEDTPISANAGPVVAQDVSSIPDLFYTVQVGVYSKELQQGELRNIGDLNVEKTGSGYFRYTSGRFDDLYDAAAHKQTVVSNGVSDAFVTAYSEGVRISVNRAQSLENDGGQNVDDTNIDPVIPVIIEETTPEPEPEIIEELRSEEELADVSELTFVVFIGSYSNSVPNNVATALLENSDVGIKRAVNGGKTIYSTKEIDTYTEATIVLQRFQEKGVDQAKMLYVLKGAEISQEQAFKILKQ